MDTKNDDRFESKNGRNGNESTPVPPTSSTADNPSVYQQPPVEQATKEGNTDKMGEDCKEDRTHAS
jgi:hypothetical protein